MKLAKRFLALAMVAVMLVSSCIIANAASATITYWSQTNTWTIDNAVTYYEYSVTGSSSGNKTTANVLEFHPDDGYVPMAFAGSAGEVLTLEQQYAAAVAKGYEVAGVINGSLFNMTYDSITGTLINEGEIISADPNEDVQELATFDADGNMGHAYSVLHFNMNIDGNEITDAIAAVNKKYGYISANRNSYINRFFYYDNNAVASDLGSSSATGYEIVCEKIDHSDLVVGGTLNAKVVEVKSGMSYGSTVPTSDEQFVLFVRSASSNASYASSLSAGDSVSIEVYETSSTAAMNAAYSGINSAYYLVKNGVDQCATQSTILNAVNGYSRPWTAFGQKADGTYVYFASEGEKMDLADVSAAMIKLGCTNVMRLDSGGSTAMYLNGTGYVYNQGRPVADCLLIVKRSSMDDEALTAKLETAVSTAKTITAPSETLSANIKAAETLLADDYPAVGEVRAALSNLTMKSVLIDLVAVAEGEDASHYTETDYAALEDAISDANLLLASSSASDSEYKSAVDTLNAALALSKYTVVSLGASYVVTPESKYDYYIAPTDRLYDDGICLTDGAKSTSDPFGDPYSAWAQKNDDGTGSGIVTITVDFGEAKDTNVYKIYSASGHWGIGKVYWLNVQGSNDGSNFTTIAYTGDVVDVGTGVSADGTTATLSTMTASSETIQNYRYIRYNVYAYGNFLWLDEVEAIRDAIAIPDEEVPVDPVDATVTLSGNVTYDGAELEGNDFSFELSSSDGSVLETVKNAADGSFSFSELIFDEEGSYTYTVKAVAGDASNVTYDATVYTVTINVTNVNDVLVAEISVNGNADTAIAFAHTLVVDNPTFLRGDVDGNGEVKTADYIILKRILLGSKDMDTLKYPETAFDRCDVNANGEVKTNDYLLLKRALLGAYKIPE